jgi:hypothetical protein
MANSGKSIFTGMGTIMAHIPYYGEDTKDEKKSKETKNA